MFVLLKKNTVWGTLKKRHCVPKKHEYTKSIIFVQQYLALQTSVAVEIFLPEYFICTTTKQLKVGKYCPFVNTLIIETALMY